MICKKKEKNTLQRETIIIVVKLKIINVTRMKKKIP